MTERKNDEEKVWYCPECDGIHVMPQGHGFLFKNENGPFIMVYEKDSWNTHKLYLVGEL